MIDSIHQHITAALESHFAKAHEALDEFRSKVANSETSLSHLLESKTQNVLNAEAVLEYEPIYNFAVEKYGGADAALPFFKRRLLRDRLSAYPPQVGDSARYQPTMNSIAFARKRLYDEIYIDAAPEEK